MATFAEKMAAMKAAKAAEAAKTGAPVPAPAAPVAIPEPQALTLPRSVTAAEPAKAPAMLVTPEHKAEVPKAQTGLISFAEKMALKKAQAAGQAPVPVIKPEDKPLVQAIKPLPPATVIPVAMVPAVIQQPKPVAQPSAQLTANSPEQAYVDVKRMIDELNTLSGWELEQAMTNLRAALLQNPSAVSLMLDEDIGKTVIAIRQIVGEAAEEAAAPKAKGGGKGKKVKAIALSDDDMESAFAELENLVLPTK